MIGQGQATSGIQRQQLREKSKAVLQSHEVMVRTEDDTCLEFGRVGVWALRVPGSGKKALSWLGPKLHGPSIHQN